MSAENGYISLEQLTAPRPVPEKDVEVSGFGKVRIRGFSVRQRTAFEKSVEGKSRAEIRERLLLATVIKPEGLTAAHLKLLGDQECSVFEPIVNAAMELTSLTTRDMDALAKNSDATDDADLTSS